jgi:hypothetical protein
VEVSRLKNGRKRVLIIVTTGGQTSVLPTPSRPAVIILKHWIIDLCGNLKIDRKSAAPAFFPGRRDAPPSLNGSCQKSGASQPNTRSICKNNKLGEQRY